MADSNKNDLREREKSTVPFPYVVKCTTVLLHYIYLYS